MIHALALRATQGVYYLALGTWFGALVMLVVAAAITFGTVRHYEPTLGAAPYNDPALADRAVPILAGGIVGNVLQGLAVIQMICAAVALGCVVIQCLWFRRDLAAGVWSPVNLLRIGLILLPTVILLADRFVISPRIWEQRAVMYDPQQSAEAREQARRVFTRDHKLNERLVGCAALLIAAAVLISPFALAGVRHDHDSAKPDDGAAVAVADPAGGSVSHG